jgi:hypothetical protein
MRGNITLRRRRTNQSQTKLKICLLLSQSAAPQTL